MAWRVANSLLVLRDQLNEAYPNRNKASDGTIGDAAHQAQVSDHNPDGTGVVRAFDVTHDPAHGCDIDQLSDALINSHDPRISYVIANGLISGPDYGWNWSTYYGDDPHTNHLHLSVVGDSRADDSRPWNIGTPAGQPAAEQGEAVTKAEIWSIAQQVVSDLFGVLEDVQGVDGPGITSKGFVAATYRKTNPGGMAALDKLFNPPVAVPPVTDDQLEALGATIADKLIEHFSATVAELSDADHAAIRQDVAIAIQSLSFSTTAYTPA